MKAWPTGERAVVLERIERHRQADAIIQGVGWDEDAHHGCAIGCSLNNGSGPGYSRAEYSRVLGVDLRVSSLVDAIHEGLTPEESVAWPGRFASALREGVDTTLLADRIFLWILRRIEPTDNAGNCTGVAALYQRRIGGDEPAVTEWDAAGDAARDAGWDAVGAAARAAAWAAAWAAAGASAWAATWAATWDATWAAAWDATWAAARDAAGAAAWAAVGASARDAAWAAARKQFWTDIAAELERRGAAGKRCRVTELA